MDSMSFEMLEILGTVIFILAISLPPALLLIWAIDGGKINRKGGTITGRNWRNDG